MREIKFRMWSERANKFFYDVENVYECLMQQHVYDGTQLARNTVAAYNHKADGIVWEQYSGLYDRNGKEIYESDVLSHPFGVVKFIDGCFCIDDLPFSNQYVDLADLEVIGNIHSNPELLKP